MLSIKITGLDELKKNVNDLVKHRMPQITAISITEVARKLKEATPAKMKEVFQNPTPWTLNGVMYMSANTTGQKAYVWFKDDYAVGKGTPASEYLRPEIEGGARELKRYEKALQRYGVLPVGYYTVPGAGAQIDPNGNMDRGQLTEILTGVRALEGMAGYGFNGKTGGYKLRKATTANYFVVKQKHGGLVPGIWERLPEEGTKIGKRKGILTPKGPEARQKGARSGKFYAVIQGRRVRPVLIFVRSAPVYQRRFPFYAWGQAFVDREFPAIFRRIAAETLAYWSAKRKAA